MSVAIYRYGTFQINLVRRNRLGRRARRDLHTMATRVRLRAYHEILALCLLAAAGLACCRLSDDRGSRMPRVPRFNFKPVSPKTRGHSFVPTSLSPPRHRIAKASVDPRRNSPISDGQRLADYQTLAPLRLHPAKLNKYGSLSSYIRVLMWLV